MTPSLPYSRYAIAFVIFATVLGAWELAVRVFSIPQIVLPAPSEVAATAARDVDQLLRHGWVTIYEIVLGFALGSTAGITIALLMTRYPLLRSITYPVIIASQTTPKIAIAPLLIIWFGVGVFPKILIVAMLALFPVLVNTIAGLESTDPVLVELMRTIDARERETYWHVRLPTAVPYIFAGLKLAITVSVIGAIVAEWVASTEGLGYLLLFYTQYMDMVRTFMVLGALIVLGSAFFALAALAERLVSWEVRARRGRRITIAETNL